MVCDLRGKYNRNKIFVHTTTQSANHARALQVDKVAMNPHLPKGLNFNFEETFLGVYTFLLTDGKLHKFQFYSEEKFLECVRIC